MYENRLTQAMTTGPITTTYTYDGDGNRVKKVVGAATTYYVGNYYEVDNGTQVKYYYFNGPSTPLRMRIAVNRGGTRSYLASDHPSAALRTGLASTSVWTDSNGNEGGNQQYYAYGANRAGSGDTPTDYQFTGQRRDFSSNLYQMGARWYDPYLNRWVQPDSIIPRPLNPQSLNRYTYTLNNPLRYIDPTGHCDGEPGGSDAACWDMIDQIKRDFPNVDIDGKEKWTRDDLKTVHDALKNHVFADDVASVKVKMIRQVEYPGVSPTGAPVAGETKLVNDIYQVIIYDAAYDVLPSGNAPANPSLHSLLNFEGTVIHELTHVAVMANPAILDSYRSSAPLIWTERFAPIGQGVVPGGNCFTTCDDERIAIATSVYMLTPDQFSYSVGPFTVTDWRQAWLQQWIQLHPRSGGR